MFNPQQQENHDLDEVTIYALKQLVDSPTTVLASNLEIIQTNDVMVKMFDDYSRFKASERKEYTERYRKYEYST